MRAESNRDLDAAADLRYYAIPEVEDQIKQLTLHKENEEKESGMLTDVVTEDNIEDIISKWTGIPVSRLSHSQADKVLSLPDALRKRVIGQDYAIEALCNAILRTRSGLARENQPTGSFFFLGPTGVGKTEIAKSLASELFDDEKNIVRIDMSEYMEQHSVSRLIGSPPGYVGYEEGGQLTEAIRRKPYSVVLLDEVEKAHPSVLNVLLEVLDDARLTDGQGRVVDFSNTIIILTSNVGQAHILNSNNEGPLSEEVRNSVMLSLRKSFKPEFLNRLDDIIIFNRLSREELMKVVKIQVNSLSKRLMRKYIEISITDDAIEFILTQSYDPAYGARPVKRYIERHLVTLISRLILTQQLPDHSIIHIDKTIDVDDFKHVIKRKSTNHL